MPEVGTTGNSVVSSVFVDRGLFALRYVSSPVTANWPRAEVLVPSELQDSIRLVAAPGLRAGALPVPGSCCIAVADSPGVLRIALTPTMAGGSLDAVIKLERLFEGIPAVALSSPSIEQPVVQTETPIQSSVVSVDASPAILAHIARRGDVLVAPGEWVAGPSAPSAIEGLQIQSLNHGPLVEIQALLAGNQQNWTPWAGTGSFVGSRRQARPLVGVRFRLSGPEAEHWVIAAEANFLGSASTIREGREVELAGPFASDPLVGLRMRVRAASRVKTSGASARSDVSREQQIRVFRAGSMSR